MTELRLGPLLRYVDEDTATVWVETDLPCEAEVRCSPAPGASSGRGAAPGGSARTWQVAGHHYALITVVGLEPGTETPYQVLLDGDQVWPPADSGMPASIIRTAVPDGGAPVRVAFGSCRWAARPEGSRHGPVGPDALEALAEQVRSGGETPDVLLLLGDQVYADETSPQVRARLAQRRALDRPPWSQVADYEEYTELYYESWLAPEVRWLLTTVPTCMIFDDHDIIDDWNTSAAWRRDIAAEPWWRERVLGGLTSYWVYQHLGNLTPGELAEDPLFAAVRAEEDGAGVLRKSAALADEDPESFRWSFRRDFGRVRLLMADSRAARVLDEQNRAMIDDSEWAWLREQARQPGCDHLLIGSSLPWLLPPAIHDTEAWNAALCAGARGERWARRGERLRRAGDLEHWAAFPASFRDLADLIAEVGGGTASSPPGGPADVPADVPAGRSGAAGDVPATVCVLSGDVHHAYLAEPHFAQPHFARAPVSRVVQLTCSPVHNSIPRYMHWGFRFGWSRPGRWLGRLISRHAGLSRPQLSWDRTGGPWFGNHLMTLALHGRSATLGLDRADAGPAEPGTGDGGTGERASAHLCRVLERDLSPPAGKS
ncbi:hypothetical protein N566_14230 [Streptomycetaceae bacterium MP113-05]|nr:hypothetical protein N566_14230 [Streptomycetaceae bacterium MP113-05]